MTQSSILVVGATGTLGLRLVRQLAAAGVKPRALVRSRDKGEAIASLATPILGDLRAPETLAEAFRGAERVFILAPPAPDMETLSAMRSTRRLQRAPSGSSTSPTSPQRRVTKTVSRTSTACTSGWSRRLAWSGPCYAPPAT
jgi:NAD(P)H-binding